MSHPDRGEGFSYGANRGMPSARSVALSSFLVLAMLPACSAVVSPDPSRLGGWDGGPGSGTDTPGGCGAGEIGCGGCVNPSNDPANCGGCGNTCPAGIACVSGRCACPPTDPRCTTRPDPLGNPDDCGPSRARCSTGQLCLLGRCVCRPPLVPVGESCVDLMSDPDNCGMVGMACGDACRRGVCAGSCGDGLTDCSGACVDVNRNPLNCGECGRACNGSEMCVAGDCRDISAATGCTSCPCSACDAACCVLALPAGLVVPYCVGADACP